MDFATPARIRSDRAAQPRQGGEDLIGLHRQEVGSLHQEVEVDRVEVGLLGAVEAAEVPAARSFRSPGR